MKKKLIFIFLLSLIIIGAVLILKENSSDNDKAKVTPFSLSNDQRKAFLHYYSPVILKRADENNKHEGHDWLTNYYYDGDSNFSNNRLNWKYHLRDYILNDSINNWNIRPTIYCAILTFMNRDNTKSAILIYNIYHPRNGPNQIHDWERIELRIDNIDREKKMPGNGETINYVVITEHDQHNEPTTYDSTDINYYIPEDSSGKHIIVWQAEWSKDGDDSKTKNELHYVESTCYKIKRSINSAETTRVDINGYNNKVNFHYVFVDENSTQTVFEWQAQKFCHADRRALYSGQDEDGLTPWNKTIRLTYELQDLADIVVTQWDRNQHVKAKGIFCDNPNSRVCKSGLQNYVNWCGKAYTIYLSEPLCSASGVIMIKAGYQRFRNRAVDFLCDDYYKQGIVGKHWFWGTYIVDTDSSTSRPRESQHDYQAHIRTHQTSSETKRKLNRWIQEFSPYKKHWYMQDSGGFDGRWIQLFED